MKIRTTKVWIVQTEKSLFRVLKGAELSINDIAGEKALVEFTPKNVKWIEFTDLLERTDFDVFGDFKPKVAAG